MNRAADLNEDPRKAAARNDMLGKAAFHGEMGAGARCRICWARFRTRMSCRGLRRTCCGLSPAFTDRYAQRPVLDFCCNTTMRGLSQMALANNSISGLLLLVAFIWRLQWEHTAGILVGALVAPWIASHARFPHKYVENGLLSFNGAFVGSMLFGMLDVDPAIGRLLGVLSADSLVNTVKVDTSGIGEDGLEVDLDDPDVTFSEQSSVNTPAETLFPLRDAFAWTVGQLRSGRPPPPPRDPNSTYVPDYSLGSYTMFPGMASVLTDAGDQLVPRTDAPLEARPQATPFFAFLVLVALAALLTSAVYVALWRLRRAHESTVPRPLALPSVLVSFTVALALSSTQHDPAHPHQLGLAESSRRIGWFRLRDGVAVPPAWGLLGQAAAKASLIRVDPRDTSNGSDDPEDLGSWTTFPVPRGSFDREESAAAAPLATAGPGWAALLRRSRRHWRKLALKELSIGDPRAPTGPPGSFFEREVVYDDDALAAANGQDNSAGSRRVELTTTQANLATLVRSLARLVGSSDALLGAVVLVSLLLCSPTGAALALVGAAVSTGVGSALGAPPEVLLAGVWGVNGALAAIAIGGLLFHLDLQGLATAVGGAAVAGVLQGALTAWLRPWGLPPLLLPSVVVVWLFHIMQVPSKPLADADIASAEGQHRWVLLWSCCRGGFTHTDTGGIRSHTTVFAMTSVETVRDKSAPASMWRNCCASLSTCCIIATARISPSLRWLCGCCGLCLPLSDSSLYLNTDDVTAVSYEQYLVQNGLATEEEVEARRKAAEEATRGGRVLFPHQARERSVNVVRKKLGSDVEARAALQQAGGSVPSPDFMALSWKSRQRQQRSATVEVDYAGKPKGPLPPVFLDQQQQLQGEAEVASGSGSSARLAKTKSFMSFFGSKAGGKEASGAKATVLDPDAKGWVPPWGKKQEEVLARRHARRARAATGDSANEAAGEVAEQPMSGRSSVDRREGVLSAAASAGNIKLAAAVSSPTTQPVCAISPAASTTTNGSGRRIRFADEPTAQPRILSDELGDLTAPEDEDHSRFYEEPYDPLPPPEVDAEAVTSPAHRGSGILSRSPKSFSRGLGGATGRAAQVARSLRATQSMDPATMAKAAQKQRRKERQQLREMGANPNDPASVEAALANAAMVAAQSGSQGSPTAGSEAEKSPDRQARDAEVRRRQAARRKARAGFSPSSATPAGTVGGQRAGVQLVQGRSTF